ncbi:hypothetical protein [Embleya scabrispora]|uniref:hypothetical protein n=1 Tax=Embleya scabrispora TaxID=159449 RepID=UPI00036A49D9|nr:hypothetical protein [Embleya scabrispora]MYS86883.1 hypothetical protein [Streptomyces sp. SID5474]
MTQPPPLPPGEDPGRSTTHASVNDHASAYLSGRDMTVDNSSRTHNNKNIVKQLGPLTLVMLVAVAVAAIVAVAWLVGRVNDDNGEPPAATPANTEITIEPNSGPPGTPIRISGTGFQPGKIVQVICQDPMNPQLGEFRAAADGSFSGEAVIPDDDWIRKVGVQLAVVAASGQAQDSDQQGLAFFTVRR